MMKKQPLEKQPWQIYLLYVVLGIAVIRQGPALLVLIQMTQAGGLEAFPDLMRWISLTMSGATAILAMMCLWMTAARQRFALRFVRGYGVFLLGGLLYLVLENIFYAPFVLYCGWSRPLSIRLADPVVQQEERTMEETRKPVKKAAAVLCGGLLILLMAWAWLASGPAISDPLLVQCISLPMLVLCLYFFIVYTRRTELNLVCILLSILPFFLNFAEKEVSTFSFILMWVSGLMAAAFAVNTVLVGILNHIEDKRRGQ